jgi:hypothetical protein
MRPSAIASLLPLLACACADPLPLYYRVEGLRVLGIRATPPEVLLDAPAPTTFGFSALVLDPRGGPVHFAWQFCPVASNRACIDWEQRRSDAPIGLRPALDAMHDPVQEGDALPANEVAPTPSVYWWAERGGWPYSIDAFSVAASADLYLYHLLDSALNAGAGATPSAVLTLTKGEETLTAFKRVVLGVRDLRSAAAPLAEQYGYILCEPGETPETQPGCLLIRDRVANTNPVFAGVRLARGESADLEFTDLELGIPGDVAGPVVMRAGETIRLLPVFTPESSEAYQSIRLDLQSQSLYVQDEVEEISVSWFVTAGRVRDKLTWPQFTKSLDTAYIAPNWPPAETDGRVTVWMVARDQRGGEAFMSVEIVVLP